MNNSSFFLFFFAKNGIAENDTQVFLASARLLKWFKEEGEFMRVVSGTSIIPVCWPIYFNLLFRIVGSCQLVINCHTLLIAGIF